MNIRKLCEWQHATDLFYFERNSYWDLFEINELLLAESFLMVPLFLNPVIFNNLYNIFPILRNCTFIALKPLQYNFFFQ